MSLTLVQALPESVHIQVYMSIVLIMVVVLLEYGVKPFKFLQNNSVDVCLKSALLLFLVFATSFLDTRGLDLKETKTIQIEFGQSQIEMKMKLFTLRDSR